MLSDRMGGREPDETRPTAFVAEMRGDGFAPDGHDPEVIQAVEQAIVRSRAVPSAPSLAREISA